MQRFKKDLEIALGFTEKRHEKKGPTVSCKSLRAICRGD